ncbi:hypothetical protein V1J52_02570 [Streptomyces sp. TRM 70351]|uniref:hypothetical protein n=1 Tax=Streptomyces sp. TRM 70351 TaxID=3116552 RepID=UPI002E7B88BE|nr:hypothetical protein [Streptomyces sp. TRM 70351]MEE1927075.1 hypothetical protein [Streptomyces sp. TRM 70351]
MTGAVELPWLVRCGEEAPRELRGHQGGVVQAPRRSALDSLSAMRQHGLPVGAVLVCLVHQVLHIPITPDEGPWRWPPSTTLCRRRTTRCGAPDGSDLGYRPCSGRFWLLPPDTPQRLTDGPALYDTLCRVRSLRRRAPSGRHRRVLAQGAVPEESPAGPHEWSAARGPDGPHDPYDPYDLCRRWTS